MTRDELVRYISRQVDVLFPDGVGKTEDLLRRDIDETLARLEFCLERVRIWRGTGFYPLHSEKNTVFLYYLANTIWRNRNNQNFCEKLFYLNKALNGFHCFYDTILPDVFFVGHSVGIVLVRAQYTNYLALYQGATVGKNHDRAPVFEEGVVLYPGSAVIGDCHIRARSYISQNTSVIDQDTPGNSVIYAKEGGIVSKPPKRDILADFFYI
jgi:serine O-acetyltransferase